MAQALDRDRFDETEYLAFAGRLRSDLQSLRETIERPSFGAGPADIGAELELVIAGADARPLPINTTLLAELADPRFQLEIDRFNIELNLTPVGAAGRPFAALEREMREALAAATARACAFGARVVPIGIMPTLVPSDLAPSALADAPRYRALARGIERLRRTPVSARVSGVESLEFTCSDVALEGANTSFQVHLRVPPCEFADAYNAAQLATPIAVALAANSPIFLEHLLWDETRIAVFKKSMEDRTADELDWRRPSRVSFGHGWVRRSAAELFAESVALYPPLFPLLSDGPDTADPPALAALRLHQGTIWRWNRAVYSPQGAGHLRIEMRALPAGPTPIDMAANAAFIVGLTAGLTPSMPTVAESFPFRYAELNFYRAARDGLDARVLWPTDRAPSPCELPLVEVAAALLPTARRGLTSLGVARDEIDRLLGVIDGRLTTGMTGSRWQRRAVLLEESRGASRRVALARMFEAYAARALGGTPVREWTLPGAPAGPWPWAGAREDVAATR